MTVTAPGKIFVFSAPSGAGKTLLLNHLTASLPNLVYSISATTRAPRVGEIDGKHYFFVTEQQFLSRVERREFAEWAKVHANYYGTPRSFIDATIASGKHIVMDIDVQGKKTFDTVYPGAIGVLILPPSMTVLEQRLRNRGTDSPETIALRLKNARTEIDFAKTSGKYEYTIVNDDLAVAEQEIVRIVKENTP